MLKKVFLSFIIIFIIIGMIIGGAYAVNENSKSLISENDTAISDEMETADMEQSEKSSNGIGLIAAALAVGLSAIGSGIAVAVVASSAVGAISENPNLLGKAVIFAGLAEGIAIYGLIISIMILSKI